MLKSPPPSVDESDSSPPPQKTNRDLLRWALSACLLLLSNRSILLLPLQKMHMYTLLSYNCSRICRTRLRLKSVTPQSSRTPSRGRWHAAVPAGLRDLPVIISSILTRIGSEELLRCAAADGQNWQMGGGPAHPLGTACLVVLSSGCTVFPNVIAVEMVAEMNLVKWVEK